ncbi:uncharacterized protein K460DRAFT_314437 [Cucurbitaria berberidis CBS 394.84]|uniref:BZIP domain-containing protein n=1 Tax=Cucurbitaria berberidis CBS 394.84 TaxID=1168544 RepID=A0A9P4GCR3_9PLEO|nr:uncharacterized protein K460DRAFT_314437 [Cucurbitaria berberidis CBS 394.84]KAF1842800.1 hypothetical protein K460DRAFT_314437 [Cucurbitaria berberidis CBS 394.84]
MTSSTNGSTSKGKTTDPERIRNNQRRCRARQKEYIASLEDKIRQYENGNMESATDQKLEQLETENKSLKRLLQSLGLRDDFLKVYNNAAHIAPNISRVLLDNESGSQVKLCSPHFLSMNSLQPHLTQIMSHEEQAQCTPGSLGPDVIASTQMSRDSLQLASPLSWELPTFPTASTSASELLQTDVHAEGVGQLTMDSLMIQAFSSAVPAENVSDTTTLCSWAFSLVLKNNLKGYSAADLDLKLRAGYRHGATPTEGCRIDNKILLTVLAEVS